MREISVEFLLTEEHLERLKKISDEYRKQHNLYSTSEEMFKSIMSIGSFHDIDRKLKFHEEHLGIG